MRGIVLHINIEITGHKGYITVGLYEDGQPGEIFISMQKIGSTMRGILDALAVSLSWNLQYGVPLEELVRKFTHVRFEPAGMTSNRELPIAKSIIDYIARWLAVKFLDVETAKKYHNKDLVDYSYAQGSNARIWIRILMVRDIRNLDLQGWLKVKVSLKCH
jgi:ribonucleoside-diphosphate reductase alpha chain